MIWKLVKIFIFKTYRLFDSIEVEVLCEMRAFVSDILFKIKQFLLCDFFATYEKTNQVIFGNVEVNTFFIYCQN